MNSKLVNIDYIIFLIYFLIVAGYGYWIYQRKKKGSMDTKDFFLAEGSLTWWAIGASLIASNISAEQFIGMSGNGFCGDCSSRLRVVGSYLTHHHCSLVYACIPEE